MASVMESVSKEDWTADDQSHLLSVLMKRLPVVAFRRRNDPSWTMEHISEGCQELTGNAPEDFLHDSKLAFGDIIHPKDRERAFEKIQKAVAQHSCYQVCFRIRAANGQERWLCEHARGVEDHGDVHFIEGIILEVSEQKRAEEELKALKRELESRVALRTAALEAANQELEAFSYSVSHDLRAPLRHISAFAHILQRNTEGRLDEANRTNLEAIISSAQRMDQLISDLLQLSRAGRQEMRLAGVPLNKLVDHVRTELSPETMGRDIEWRIARLPTAEADASLLRQVFINLLANAIKYTRPRAKAIIEIGSEEREHEFLIFVRDNGVGFEPKYANRLFGVFQRLHTESEFEGTGIGLAIVRRIVSRHCGTVWAEGKVGEGATFFFTLPKSAHKEGH